MQFSAGDRVDTVVEVRPRDPRKDADVRAAEQTEVGYANGVLTITAPKPRYVIPRNGCVDVTVDLPNGSRVELNGSAVDMVGPNGAGKTTTVRSLCTLIAADGGRAQVAGHDVAASPDGVRAAIGVTGQFSAVDGLITGEENMLLMADLHHLPRREGRRVTGELLERFASADAAGKPVSSYSGGMRRRLDIAMTLVGAPRVIFLDEPTAGLDPRSRHNMWQIIGELVADGVTVFLTTPHLDEADELADRIALLNDGRIAAEGTAEELKRLVPGGHVRLRFTDPAGLIGHVVGSVMQCVLSAVLVGAVAVAIGFRSTGASPLERLPAAGNNAPPLMILPLLSSAFVPVDALPGWFGPIAEYQPLTPAVETLRGLLLGTGIGDNWWRAVLWSVGLAVLGYFWSKSLFNRTPK